MPGTCGELAGATELEYSGIIKIENRSTAYGDLRSRLVQEAGIWSRVTTPVPIRRGDAKLFPPKSALALLRGLLLRRSLLRSLLSRSLLSSLRHWIIPSSGVGFSFSLKCPNASDKNNMTQIILFVDTEMRLGLRKWLLGLKVLQPIHIFR